MGADASVLSTDNDFDEIDAVRDFYLQQERAAARRQDFAKAQEFKQKWVALRRLREQKTELEAQKTRERRNRGRPTRSRHDHGLRLLELLADKVPQMERREPTRARKMRGVISLERKQPATQVSLDTSSSTSTAATVESDNTARSAGSADIKSDQRQTIDAGASVGDEKLTPRHIGGAADTKSYSADREGRLDSASSSRLPRAILARDDDSQDVPLRSRWDTIDADDKAGLRRLQTGWLRSAAEIDLESRAKLNRLRVSKEGFLFFNNGLWGSWRRMHFVLFERGAGLWYTSPSNITSSGEGSTISIPRLRSMVHVIVPDAHFGHDTEHERQLRLSESDLKTEFVVSGTHTHHAVARLDRWHLQAQNTAERRSWLRAIRRERDEWLRTRRVNMIEQSRAQKDPYQRQPIDTVLKQLVHGELAFDACCGVLLHHKEFIATNGLFSVMLSGFEGLVQRVEGPKRGQSDYCLRLLTNLVKLWSIWATHSPEDFFAPRVWAPPGDFADKSNDEAKKIKRSLSVPLGRRLLFFLDNLHMCGNGFWRRVMGGGLDTVGIVDPSFIKSLDHRGGLYERVEALKSILETVETAKSKAFISFGERTDQYDVRVRSVKKRWIPGRWQGVDERNTSKAPKVWHDVETGAEVRRRARVFAYTSGFKGLQPDSDNESDAEFKEAKADPVVRYCQCCLRAVTRWMSRTRRRWCSRFCLDQISREYCGLCRERFGQLARAHKWMVLARPTHWSFDDLQMQRGRQLGTFFMRTDPHFLRDGVVAFSCQEVAEQLFLLDLELLRAVPSRAFLTGAAAVEGGDLNPALSRVQSAFARRVLWVAAEILKKREQDADEMDRAASIARVASRFIDIAERSLTSLSGKRFNNLFGVYAIATALSLDYVDWHMQRWLDRSGRSRLVALKSACGHKAHNTLFTSDGPCLPLVPRISLILQQIHRVRERYPEPRDSSEVNVTLYHSTYPIIRTVQNIKDRDCKTAGLQPNPTLQLYFQAAMHNLPPEAEIMQASELASKADSLAFAGDDKDERDRALKPIPATRQANCCRCCKAWWVMTAFSIKPLVAACAAAVGYTAMLVFAFSGNEEYGATFVRAGITGSVNFLSTLNFLYIYWFEFPDFFSKDRLQVSEMSIFGDRFWGVWAGSASIFTGLAFAVTDSFNGADVATASTEVEYIVLTVISNGFEFFFVFQCLPLVIDDRKHSDFRFCTSFVIFMAFVAKLTNAHNFSYSVYCTISAVLAVAAFVWKDSKEGARQSGIASAGATVRSGIRNNPDYLQLFALAVVALPTGIGRPLFQLQHAFGDDQWSQVAFFGIWTAFMEIIRMLFAQVFYRGVHQHEDSWVVLFPLRLFDVVVTAMLFLFISPSFGWLVCLGITIVKDLLRDSGFLIEWNYRRTHPDAQSHEVAIYLVTWYNLSMQTVTSEIVAVLMLCAVVGTEIALGETYGYAVTGGLSQTERMQRFFGYAVLLAAAFATGQVSTLYLRNRFRKAKRFMWRTNRSRKRGDVNLMQFPSLLNKGEDLDRGFVRFQKSKYAFFYTSQAVAIFGITLYNAVLVARLAQSGNL